MAKLVDAPSSGGGAARRAGSNPVPGTKAFPENSGGLFCLAAKQARLCKRTNKKVHDEIAAHRL